MSNELLTILEYIEQERGIRRDVLVKAIETALLSASKKSIHPASQLSVRLDPDTGDIQAFAKLEVVASSPNHDQLLFDQAKTRLPDVKLGDVVEWEVTPSNFGRIAAQTAKQAIMQQLRKAEKETVRDEFADKVGHIVNGIVRRFEGGNIIVDFQKAEGVLNAKEKIFGEQYMPGDRINVLLLKVDTNSAGPSLIVSRTHPDFVKRLFEREVSEIHDGVVQIMGISREAGSRTKISVKSNDPRVDPVGACVGLRGIRVKNITNELGGERVDIIPFDADTRQYAINSLQPAKVQTVEVFAEKKELRVHVTPDQSRLAFGKKAQNVRLSSKLLGWNMNIVIDEPKKVESLAEKIERASGLLADTLGISSATAHTLVNNGFVSMEGLKAAGREQLLSIGIDETEVNQIFLILEN